MNLTEIAQADDNIKRPPNTIIFWSLGGARKMFRWIFGICPWFAAILLLAAFPAWGRGHVTAQPVAYALADGTRLTGYL